MFGLLNKLKVILFSYVSEEFFSFVFLEGYYNISNEYGIEDDYTIHSNNLESFARENGLWNGKDKINFSETFQYSSCGDGRLAAGKKLIENLTKNGNFSAFEMMSILRDDQSGICMLGEDGDFITTGSQVSVLLPKHKQSEMNACHFFTGTPNPKLALFKPFIFSDNVELGPLTVSTPAEITPKRIHPLYAAHAKAQWERLDSKRLKDFEHEGILEIIAKLKSSDENNADTYETLFHDSVSAEIELLRDHPPAKRP